jgi:hypothetical protein
VIKSCGQLALSSVVSVGETVGTPPLIPSKYRSEWQDLNLRPPRPERGESPAIPADSVLSCRCCLQADYRAVIQKMRHPLYATQWGAW